MTAPQPGPVQQPAPTGGGSQGGDSGQYAEYLNGVPEQFHAPVLDGLKRADTYWRQQTQDAQSRYAPYEQVISGYDPEYLGAAAELMSELHSNPSGTLAQLAEALGADLGGQGAPQQQGSTNPPQQQYGQQFGQQPPQEYQQLNEQFGTLQQQFGALAQYLVEQREQQELQGEADQLDAQLRGMFGEQAPDDDGYDYVLSLIESGRYSPEQAVAQYRQLASSHFQGQAPGAAPVVMPAGGGTQSNQVDPRTADRKSRIEMALGMARQGMTGG